MTTYLLDSSALIALAVHEHEHNEVVSAWLQKHDQFALCPIVEGALVRFLVRLGERPQVAVEFLRELHSTDGWTFWPDSISYREADLTNVIGHRQVTDAYLVALATSKHAVLATLDEALSATAGVELIST